MKSLIAVLALTLTACNSPVEPTVSPTTVDTVANTEAPAVTPSVSAPTPVATVTPEPSVSPSVSPSPEPSPVPYAYQGAGTLDSPYQVSTPDDLQNIDVYPSAVFEITHDLYMTNYEFRPLGDFSGKVIGGSHSIYDLTIATTGVTPAALFRTVSGNVTNLSLRNAFISSAAGAYASAFAVNVSGSLTYCTVTASVVVSGKGSPSSSPDNGAAFGFRVHAMSGEYLVGDSFVSTLNGVSVSRSVNEDLR